MLVRVEPEVLQFLPSLFLGLHNCNVFITTVEGIYLLGVREVANLENESPATARCLSLD